MYGKFHQDTQFQLSDFVCGVWVCEQAEPGLCRTWHSPPTDSDSDSDSDSDATVSSVFTFSTPNQRYISQILTLFNRLVHAKNYKIKFTTSTYLRLRWRFVHDLSLFLLPKRSHRRNSLFQWIKISASRNRTWKTNRTENVM